MYWIIYIIGVIISAVIFNFIDDFFDDEFDISFFSIIWPLSLIFLLAIFIIHLPNIIANTVINIFNKHKKNEIIKSDKQTAFNTLDKINFQLIEQYVRMKKIKKIK